MQHTWDVLARQYLARHDEALLTQAIEAATDLDLQALLHTFEQEDVKEAGRRAKTLLRTRGQEAQALTVELLVLDLRTRLTERFNKYPLEQQVLALQIGIDACTEAASRAQALGDRACVAFYRSVQAGGLHNAGAMAAARDAYEEALEIRRQLAQDQPQVYVSDVAMTLNNLGLVLSDLQELDAARDAYEEALPIYRGLAQAQPQVYVPYVATTLNNLGIVLRGLRKLAAARTVCDEALEIRRHLAQAQPQVYVCHVATTLNNLGVVLSDLQELDAARDAYKEALEIRRQLAQTQPQVYMSDVAMTLNNLGTVLGALQELDAARDAYEEALPIYRGLAQAQPQVYVRHVATTLNNLGIVLSALRELAAARDAYKEALPVYRGLERSQPGVYLSDVAMTLNNLGTVLRDLQELDAARDAHKEALPIYRGLERSQPGVYLSDVAMTLNNLGTVLRDLQELDAARDAHKEALEIRRHLAQAQPQVYVSDVAMTLNNLGIVLSDLQELDAARDAYEEALPIYRGLTQAQPQIYLPHVATTLNNLGAVLSDLRELAASRKAFEEAIALDEDNGMWLDASLKHFNLGRMQEDDNPTAQPSIREHFRKCVQRCEQGLRQLQETQHRDKFKGKIERAYTWLIEDAARRVPDEEKVAQSELLGLLEAVRQVGTLAELGVVPDDAPSQSQTKAFVPLLGLHNAALLWAQATPKAVVFALQTPETGLRVALAEPVLLERMRSLVVAIRRAIAIRAGMQRAPAHEVATMNVLTAPVAEEAQKVYGALPDIVKALLTDRPERAVFVIPCYTTVNVPWELIQTPTSSTPSGWEYLGLQRHLPRLHSARHLAQMLQRQPQRNNVVPTAIVVGDPTQDLEYSYFAAEELQAFLKRTCGFQLVPNNTALIREKATKEALEASLEQEFLLWVQLSHGGGDETHLYLAMANGGKVYPHSIAQRHWPQHPIVHQACCYTGLTAAEGGGRFSGHPTAALLAGASCVLSSTMPLFDREDAEFCARLYHRALNPAEPQTFGEALLAARREMAQEYGGNPMMWGQYALWGNPWARLMA